MKTLFKFISIYTKSLVLTLCAAFIASITVALGWHMMLNNSLTFDKNTIEAVVTLSLTWQLLCLPAFLFIYIPLLNWIVKAHMNLNYFALCGLGSSTVIGFPLCFFMTIDKSVELYTPDLLIYYIISGLLTGIVHYYLILFIDNIKTLRTQ